MSRDRDHLVWIDLETTGLSVARHVILEIASVVTDKNLNVVGEGPDLVIHQPESALARLDPWCARQHGHTGLIDSSGASDISLREAEQRTLTFVRKHTHRQTAPLCGNSIQTDRRFLRRYMPELTEHLNHRNIDVSSIAELAARWYPGVATRLDKTYLHRAAPDIRESIEELRFYRDLIFRD